MPVYATREHVGVVVPAHPGTLPSQRTNFQCPAGVDCGTAVSWMIAGMFWAGDEIPTAEPHCVIVPLGWFVGAHPAPGPLTVRIRWRT